MSATCYVNHAELNVINRSTAGWLTYSYSIINGLSAQIDTSKFISLSAVAKTTHCREYQIIVKSAELFEKPLPQSFLAFSVLRNDTVEYLAVYCVHLIAVGKVLLQL